MLHVDLGGEFFGWDTASLYSIVQVKNLYHASFKFSLGYLDMNKDFHKSVKYTLADHLSHMDLSWNIVSPYIA